MISPLQSVMQERQLRHSGRAIEGATKGVLNNTHAFCLPVVLVSGTHPFTYSQPDGIAV